MTTASQLERVMACPASAALPKARSTDSYSERGTAIHDYLENVFYIGADAALAKVPSAYAEDCAMIPLEKFPWLTT